MKNLSPLSHRKKSAPMTVLRCYKALCYLRLRNYLNCLLRRPLGALPRGASSRLIYVGFASKDLSCKALWTL
jgi:hypothetical protein